MTNTGVKETKIQVTPIISVTHISFPDNEGYCRTDNNVYIPVKVIKKIANNKATDKDISSWFMGKFEGFGAEDEIRSELISMLNVIRIYDVFNFEEIDKISGIELYKNNLIQNYAQQGDVLLPLTDNKTEEVGFEDLSNEMMIRLNSTISYKLLEGMFLGERIVALEMTNASLFLQTNEIHIEYVDPSVKTVFEAIQFRNRDILNHTDKVGLPEIIS
jgi:hypothetical protein